MGLMHFGSRHKCGFDLFEHLCHHPRDFRRALQFVPLRLRVIHAFAFQSFLWNRAVSNLLRAGVRGAQRLRLSTLAGDLLAWKYLSPEREEKLKSMRTPLFGIDGDGGSPPFKKAMVDELKRAELRRSDFVEHEVQGAAVREGADGRVLPGVDGGGGGGGGGGHRRTAAAAFPPAA